MVEVHISELKNIARKAILSYGYSAGEAEIILDVLLYAQIRDNNQGFVKLVGQGIPKDAKADQIVAIRETELSAVLDGNRNMGILVLQRATEIAIEKARHKGISIVGTNNTSSSTGAIGYYTSQCAERGLIGLVFSRSPEIVAPHGSYEPVFGTNPLAIGIPTKEGPLVLDMSTAAITYYGLMEATIARGSIPDDIAYDGGGQPTTDPTEAIGGAVRTFDRGHKGSGLAMVIEILAGPLVGAAYAGMVESSENWGNLIIVIDPNILIELERFEESVTQLVKKVRNSKKLSGVENVLVPGERGNQLALQRLRSGTIQVEDNLLNALKNVTGS